MLTKFWVLGLAVVLTAGNYSIAAVAADFTLPKGAGRLEFDAIGSPSALKVHGKTDEIEGKVHSAASGLSGSFEVNLDSLTTGISMRDHHMKVKYLETPKFPKATFSVTKVGDLKAGAPIVAGTYPVEGELQFHGQKKPVTGQITVLAPAAGKIPFEAALPVNLSDFAITKPSFMGITIQDLVNLKITGTLSTPDNATKY